MNRILAILSLLFVLLIQANGQINFELKEELEGKLIVQLDSMINSDQYGSISSVLVAKNGVLVHEKYYFENDSNAVHNTRSATKTIATFLTGIAIDDGYIDSEQDKIYKYLQHKMPVKNPDPRKDAISIEDLLTMGSILECDDWNNHSRGHEERMYYIEDWTQFLLDLPVRAYPFGPKPADRPYGRAFAYASAKAAAVAEIVESAVGRPAHEYLKEKLLTPLDFKNYVLHFNPMGILNTAGGSEYRSRDFLKIMQMCLNGGKWNGKQVISSEWLSKATTPKAHAYDENDYGYFIWLSNFGKDKNLKGYYMAGNGGNKILAIPELDIAIVITAQNYNQRNAHQFTEEIVNKYILPHFEK